MTHISTDCYNSFDRSKAWYPITTIDSYDPLFLGKFEHSPQYLDYVYYKKAKIPPEDFNISWTEVNEISKLANVDF